VIAILSWPAVRTGLERRDLAQTMKNGRELYLVALRMATDGAANSDPSRAWPGDYPINSLAEYSTKLIGLKYASAADLERLFTAPEAKCSVTFNGTDASLGGKSALKIYKVRSSDPSNTIFAASANYVYATPLTSASAAFGDIGFVVIRKSGDAGVYKPGQATPAWYENNPSRFQSELGALPGATKGTVSQGDAATALAGPR
jgi:hypothetical protein